MEIKVLVKTKGCGGGDRTQQTVECEQDRDQILWESSELRGVGVAVVSDIIVPRADVQVRYHTFELVTSLGGSVTQIWTA